MDEYVVARLNVFFTGRDGSLRSNRVLCQLAGQYAVDAFIGSTLQDGRRRATPRRSRKGAWPVLEALQIWGTILYGRRHSAPACPGLMASQSPVARGRKLVVQTVETFHDGNSPAFVEILDAVAVGRKAGMPLAPVMIYGDDVSHVVTEVGHHLSLQSRGSGGTPARPRSRSRR